MEVGVALQVKTMEAQVSKQVVVLNSYDDLVVDPSNHANYST